jgi:acetylornithine aminotransferase
VFEVTGRGLMRGVVLTEPRAADVQSAALDAGLVLNAPTPDRLRIVPPLVITEAETAQATTTLSGLLTEVLA